MASPTATVKGSEKMTFCSSISDGPGREGDYGAYAHHGAGNPVQRKTSRSRSTQTLYGVNSLSEITNTIPSVGPISSGQRWARSLLKYPRNAA
jgi:hypothetical protein